MTITSSLIVTQVRKIRSGSRPVGVKLCHDIKISVILTSENCRIAEDILIYVESIDTVTQVYKNRPRSRQMDTKTLNCLLTSNQVYTPSRCGISSLYHIQPASCL